MRVSCGPEGTTNISGIGTFVRQGALHPRAHRAHAKAMSTRVRSRVAIRVIHTLECAGPGAGNFREQQGRWVGFSDAHIVCRTSHRLGVDTDLSAPRVGNLAHLAERGATRQNGDRHREHAARTCVAILCMAAARKRDDARLATVVGELPVQSPDLRQWWGSAVSSARVTARRPTTARAESLTSRAQPMAANASGSVNAPA
ncbi:MAG: hypothetical protein JWO62_223 [Acidimicrobiaceae bacterium]|nr:hypothetical protein [Acidimicrobiaceae bacterium]